MRSLRFLPEFLIALTVFIAGVMVGGAYRDAFVASGAPQEFAQQEFAAAVALACGHGFLDPGYAPTPAFAEFLQRKRDRITCADLPAETPLKGPNLTQGLYRYLMSAASLIWVLSGDISWSANYVQGGWIESHLSQRWAERLLSMPGLQRENDVVIATRGWVPPPSAARQETVR